MATGSRLYHLKKWLTIEDAANHLSAMLAEKVTTVDILELCIQRRLKLSVHLLAGAYANRGVVCRMEEAHVLLKPVDAPLGWELKRSYPAGSLEEKLASIGRIKAKDVQYLDEDVKDALMDESAEIVGLSQGISDTEIVEFNREVKRVEAGIYDLPMLSAEAYAVEEMYYDMIGGPEVDWWSLDGAWIEGDGCLLRLCERVAAQEDYDACGTEKSVDDWMKRYMEPSRWFPIGRLPKESTIVVRRQNLDAFISSLDEQPLVQSTEGEELRALEALGLLAETVAKQAPKYQRNGKPNKAQIAEAMSQQAGEVYGMSQSKLARLLSDALDAWEEKRG